MKIIFLIIIGIALVIEGFSTLLYLERVMFAPTDPPMMTPVEGIAVLYLYRQAFLFSGIVGIVVTLIGVAFWWKKR